MRKIPRLPDGWLLCGSPKVQKTEELEVLDIDEERYRREELSTRLYGYLLVPREKTLTQNRKAPTPVSETHRLSDCL